MKESVIDVLMYIFSSYADQDESLPEDRNGIEYDLRAAGFEPLEIDKAFAWLDGLAQAEDVPEMIESPHATRIYTDEDSLRLGANARGFLVFLEQSGGLTPTLRLMTISRRVGVSTPDCSRNTRKPRALAPNRRLSSSV